MLIQNRGNNLPLLLSTQPLPFYSVNMPPPTPTTFAIFTLALAPFALLTICSIAHRSRRLIYIPSALYVIWSLTKHIICFISNIYDCLDQFALHILQLYYDILCYKFYIFRIVFTTDELSLVLIIEQSRHLDHLGRTNSNCKILEFANFPKK